MPVLLCLNLISAPLFYPNIFLLKLIYNTVMNAHGKWILFYNVHSTRWCYCLCHNGKAVAASFILIT